MKHSKEIRLGNWRNSPELAPVGIANFRISCLFVCKLLEWSLQWSYGNMVLWNVAVLFANHFLYKHINIVNRYRNSIFYVWAKNPSWIHTSSHPPSRSNRLPRYLWNSNERRTKTTWLQHKPWNTLSDFSWNDEQRVTYVKTNNRKRKTKKDISCNTKGTGNTFHIEAIDQRTIKRGFLIWIYYVSTISKKPYKRATHMPQAYQVTTPAILSGALLSLIVLAV